MTEPADYDAAFDARWWDEHDNVVSVAYYMAEHRYPARVLALLIEKPWKYTDVYVLWHTEWLEEQENDRP